MIVCMIQIYIRVNDRSKIHDKTKFTFTKIAIQGLRQPRRQTDFLRESQQNQVLSYMYTIANGAVPIKRGVGV